MLRTLAHHWRVNLAVALGAAVATAVLAGALMVGDSIRGSLRDLTLERLGRIDHALLTERFFRESLADDLVGDSEAGETAPVILLRGAAVHADTARRASRVAVNGVDGRFAGMFEEADGLASLERRREGQIFPSVVINESLRRELEAKPGDALLLSFPRFSTIPRDTLMGETDPDDVLATVRMTLTAVLPDEGVGRFGLSPHQVEPFNAFVALRQLQRALDQPESANGILAAGPTSPETALTRALGLEDAGLVVERREDHLAVESREFVLRPDIDETVGSVAAELGLPMMRVQTYLANTVSLGDRLMPYSLVTAVNPLGGLDAFSLVLADGSPAPRLDEEDVLLSTWAAEDLGASPGDTVEIGYYVVGPREELLTRTARLRVAGVVAMEGLAGDRKLTPEYPGIQDADDISEWNPPFPVFLDLVRPKDESYWDRYGATPKAFVSEETGRRLWTSRFGTTTSVRIGAGAGESLDAAGERFRAALREALLGREDGPAAFGFRFRPVKEEGLEAATGATDFAGLFVGFSFFLIVSAALLVGLLFSLGVERRAREIGLLRAVGYRVRSIRTRLLAEGGLLAGVGALLGVLVGVGYAWLMMAGLRTLWVGAVGSTRLFLHVQPLSVALGWVIAVVVVLASIAGAVFRLSKLPPPALLAGSVRKRSRSGRGRIAAVLAWGGAAGGLALLAYALFTGALTSPALAFGTGALLLIAGLSFFSLWCRGSGAGRLRSRLGMAARNSSWNPRRSMLSVALVGSACFVIVTVAANRRELGDELRARDSATGGFALVAESDVPLHQDLDREDDRFDLGFSEADFELLEEVRVYPLRVLPGEDASCLNLYKPEKPRVLGMPADLLRRGGFSFQKTLELPEGEEDPWNLLYASLEPGVVPAILDAGSAQWILHKKLGDDIVLDVDRLSGPARSDAGEDGEPAGTVRLRIVGLLQRSILQSEVLISEENFETYFPGRTGYGYFLIDAPFERADEVGQLLENRLSPFGFDGTSTIDKLAGFLVVEHTYLSTFQTLGGLGLLLGTVGLGIVLVRNVIERRGELATLRAFGFRRSSLAWMVLAENAFLLITGVLIGSLAALIAVVPQLTTIHMPWRSLLGTLAVVLLVGMLSSVVAVLGTLRVPLLPALKSE